MHLLSYTPTLSDILVWGLFVTLVGSVWLDTIEREREEEKRAKERRRKIRQNRKRNFYNN